MPIYSVPKLFKVESGQFNFKKINVSNAKECKSPIQLQVENYCQKYVWKCILWAFLYIFFGELVAHTGDQVIYFNTYLGLHLGDSRLILESWHRYIMCLSIFGGFSCK